MKSLYGRLGGDEIIDELVRILYRNVLDDDLLVGFFDDVDMSLQQRKFRMFLHLAAGGPHTHSYSVLQLRAVHERAVSQGMSKEHVDGLLGHLKAAMEELEVGSELVDQVLSRVEDLAGDILGR